MSAPLRVRCEMTLECAARMIAGAGFKNPANVLNQPPFSPMQISKDATGWWGIRSSAEVNCAGSLVHGATFMPQQLAEAVCLRLNELAKEKTDGYR